MITTRRLIYGSNGVTPAETDSQKIARLEFEVSTLKWRLDQLERALLQQDNKDDIDRSQLSDT